MTTDFRVPIVNWSYGTLQAEHADKLECEMLSDVENPKKIIAILASDNKGHSYLSKRDDPYYCNNFIAIRNRKTNAVRFFATDQYLMSPYCASEKIKSNSFVKSEEKNDKLNSSLTLSKVMGSKRNKRRIMEIEKTNVNVDNIEKKLKKAIKAEEVNVEVDVKPIVTTNAAVVPPCNRAAESVESVYDVRELMSPDVLDNLEYLAREVIQYSDEELSADTKFTKFFSSVLTQIDNKSVIKVKMLLFADSLIQFLNFPARYLKNRNIVICQYSSALNEKLINEFCTSLMDGKLARPPSMRDKALCYILVLLLLIKDFTVNISVLSGHIGTTEYQKLPRLMRAVGAKSVGKTAVDFSLSLPLAELSLGMGKARYGSKKK